MTLHSVLSSVLPPMHMGALHPAEQALTLILAVGPFVVLGLVVLRRRRVDAEEEAGAEPSVETQRDR